MERRKTNPFLRLSADVMQKIIDQLATRYNNKVEVSFNWIDYDFCTTRLNEPLGTCFARLQIEWNKSIENRWRYTTDQAFNDLLQSQYELDEDGFSKNLFVKTLQKKQKENNLDVTLKDIQRGNSYTDHTHLVLDITGLYKKERSFSGSENYEHMDWESDRGKKIKDDFKRCVVDVITSVTKKLLSPPDTPSQPLNTKDYSGYAMFYDKPECFDGHVNIHNDYKLETTDVFEKKYWIDLLESEPTIKYQNNGGEEYRAFLGAFLLIDNKRIASSKGLEGAVVYEYKFKF